MKLKPWWGGPLGCRKVRSVCTIMVPPSGDWRAGGSSLAKSTSSVVILQPFRGGMFWLGDSWAACTIASPPLWVSGYGGADLASLASLSMSSSFGKRSSMSMRVIAKVFLDASSWDIPRGGWFWRRPKNVTTDFSHVHLFRAHQVFSKTKRSYVSFVPLISFVQKISKRRY